jgi:CRP/FNR family cyclic AMP-dependent transcriptional regulator
MATHGSSASDDAEQPTRRQKRGSSPTAEDALRRPVTGRPQPDQLWQLLTSDQRGAIESVATRHAHPAGTVLLNEGTRARSVLVLRSGRAKVVASGRNGRRALLAIRVPGDIVGELGAIDGRPRSATVVAIDPVTLLRVSTEDFEDLLTTESGIALPVLKVVIGRLRSANLRRTEYGETTVADRVATTLAELAEEHGRIGTAELTIGLPFGQEDLADMVVGSREAVVRALKALRDDDVITTGRQRITILQPDVLGHRAGRSG